MGCGYSKHFLVDEDVPGQDSLANEIFKQLHLTQNDVDILYTAFCDMDADTSHFIRRDEFCAYFKLEKTAMTVKMVKMMDTEHNGGLNFCEMVGLMWDFLSRGPHDLGSFAFYLLDEDITGVLSAAEVTELVELLHHTTPNKHNKGVKKIIADLFDKMVHNKIQVAAFHNYCKQHDEVCLLLFGLQNSLRERMFGVSFWEEMAKRRESDPAQMKAAYIMRLYVKMKAEKAKRAKKQAAANKSQQEKQRVAKVPTKQRPCRRNSILKASPVLVHKKDKSKLKTHNKRKHGQKVHSETHHEGEVESEGAPETKDQGGQ